MRFLKVSATRELNLTKDLGTPPASYAILSHTWGSDDDEVTFDDVQSKTGTDKTGYTKLWFCADQAERDRLEYFWIDTCCINKADHVELSEAITSMFRWYQEAAKCYVYLSDVSVNNTSEKNMRQVWEAAFRSSKWFTRGWTLQELLAPTSVEFFSMEGTCLGDKQTLERLIWEITSIPIRALQGVALSTFAIDERLRWAEGRHTKKVEDQAYSLLGIFGVFMPLIYGEGKNAHIRLRREIEAGTGVASPSAVIPFDRDADFVERGTILDEIHNQYILPASRTALVGLGGVGKSQLAIEHAFRIRDRSPDTWTFWVHASNAARFEQSYHEIANRVKIPGRGQPKADILQLVYDWLADERKGRWLIILDNVDDAEFLFKARGCGQAGADDRASGEESEHRMATRPLVSYLPRCPHGTITITTRSQEAALRLVEPRCIIAINPMTERDALSLLQKKLGIHNNADYGAALVQALEYMPLAIAQCAAYISQRAPQSSVPQYLEKFRESDRQRASLLNFEGGQLRRDVEAKNSVITTWQISFDHIRKVRSSAADLLSLMSFFDRQGIPEDLLQQRPTSDGRAPRQGERRRTGHRGRVGDDESTTEEEESSTDEEESTSSKDRLEDDIATLRNYLFINVTTTRGAFEMHSLVQLATQRWLKATGEHERWTEQFISNLADVFPTGRYENWTTCQRLYPHAKSAVVKKPKTQDHIVVWASLLYRAGWYALEAGNWPDAEKMSSQSVKALKKLFGEEHPDTLSSMANLAATYRNQGRWKEAEELEVQVKEISFKVLGEEHPDTLTSMANLASTYWNQGRWKEAEELEVQVKGIRTRVLGEEHPSTLTSMANLASTYQNQGRWKEAEELDVQVKGIRTRVLGEEHPDTLTSMANLASTYRNQGRWKEAEELEVQVKEISFRVLGEEHPSTLTSMANLASTYWNQGRWKEAEELEVQVKEIRTRVLGEEHPSTLTSMANLASTYWNQGRWKEAEELDVQVKGIRTRVLREEHPSTLTSMANLASTYQNQGRWKEAEELDVQVKGIRTRVLGEEHPDTLTSMANLASTYWNQGRWKEAEELEVQVKEISFRVLGEEHPSTLTSMANLASTYRNQGRWKEAEELEVQVKEISFRVLGEEHPSTLTSMANLASTYRNQGRWKEAEELEVQVKEISFRVLGEEHPDTLSSMANLASTYQNQGRWKEAEELDVQVKGIRTRVLGEEHPSTLTSMANLASTYWNQGRWKEAEELEVQVKGIRTRVLGEEHPSTLTSMANLASTYQNQGRWKEAEELDVQVKGIRTRVLGEEHPDTLTSMANLASTYRNQGRWKEAEELEVQVKEISFRVLGEEHPSTLTSMANLASTYWNQGRWKEAEELEVQVKEIRTRVLGEEHPSTLTSMANLASTYRNQGQFSDALVLLSTCLKLCNKILGSTHPHTRTVAATLQLWQDEQELNVIECTSTAPIASSM